MLADSTPYDGEIWLPFLETFREHTLVGLALLDAQLRFVRVNPAMIQLAGQSGETLPGRSVAEVLPELGNKAAEFAPGVMASGTPLRNLAAESWLAGRQQTWLLSLYPLPRGENAAGVAAGVDGAPTLGLVIQSTTRHTSVAREAQQAEARMRTLQQLTSALSQALSTRDVNRVVLEQAVRATGAFSGSIISPLDDNTLTLVGAYGYEDGFLEQWRSFAYTPDFPAADALLRRQPVFETQAGLRERYPAFLAHLRPRTWAVAAVPLVYGERLLGGLTLSFEGEAALADEQQAYILAVADQCVQALERARLHDAGQRAHERATLLSEAGSLLASTLNPEETLERLTQLAVTHVADACAVYLPAFLDGQEGGTEEGELRLVALTHRDEGKVEGLRQMLAQLPSNPGRDTSNAWVMRTGQHVLIPRLPPEYLDGLPDKRSSETLRTLGLHSMITVPLFSRGRTIGVMRLASTDPARSYGEDDVTLALELARRAALALDNAQLYQESLRNERRYRSLVNATTQTVWTSNPQGQITEEQPGWARLTGQTRQEYEGDGWTTRIHPADHAAVQGTWRRALATGQVFENEHRMQVASGEYRHFHVRAVPVLTVEGQVAEWVGIHTDITERVAAKAALVELNSTLEARVEERTAELRHANEELRHANEELARSNIELERFAYVASHDLQEPLRTIASFTQLLEERYAAGLDEQGRTFLRLVVQGARRLKNLIDDLLVFSRLNAQRGPAGLVSLEEVFGDVTQRLETLMQESGATLTHEKLPSVPGVPSELTQLLQNLLGNALKFRAPGKALRVHVGAERQEEGWHLWVQDNGIGIEPQYQRRIFELFLRLHRRDQYEGTGLGLAIARKIVERHGGRLWLESTPGQGSTFHFILPAAQAQAAQEHQSA